MITAHIRPLRTSTLHRPPRFFHAALLAMGVMICALTGCVQSASPYRLLSDEVVGMIASPPYSAEQVKNAQITLRQRSAARLRETVIQSQLKSFACLIVSQQLDPTSARGEKAPSELPCSFDPKRRCAHRCKRSRLPPDIRLPKEYRDTAQRHDDIIWQDLNRVSESGVNPQWESYLTQCLECEHSKAIKRRVCLRDIDGVELTAERRAHSPLDRWLNQCSSLDDPEIKALVKYRAAMLTPPEDLAYPLLIERLPDHLQAKLTSRAIIGEGMRLLSSTLNESRISALLNSKESKLITNERWFSIQEKLRRRLDAPLMPCLEQGLDTCIVAGQIAQAREQARQYLEGCVLCEHRGEIERWREGVSLAVEPVWRSQGGRSVEVALRHQRPSSLLIREGQEVSRFGLSESSERLLWTQTLTAEISTAAVTQTSLTFWPPKPEGMTPLINAKSPLLLASDELALYALDPQSGALRWRYRSPFDQSGTLAPCLSVEPLPSGLIAGSLNDGGAICYKRSSIHIVNTQGDLAMNLLCDDSKGCGQRVALAKVSSALEAGPPIEHSLLVMSHPSAATSSQAQTLTLYRLQERYKEDGTLIIQTPQVIDTLMGEWDSLLLTPTHHSREHQAILLGTKRDRGRLTLSAIRLSDEKLLWRRQLKGRALLHKLSLREDMSAQNLLIGALSDREFNVLELETGEILFKESLPLKRASAQDRLLALNMPLSWELLSTRLIVLHPLNRSLYFKNLSLQKSTPALKRSSLEIEDLDPRARLLSIDAQWVVTSPKEGKVLGLHPQLDQIVWRWGVEPFEHLSLSHAWALFTHKGQGALYQIKAKSLDELAIVAQGSNSLSACSQGDRWACLYQGDLLIGIPEDLASKDRERAISKWYQVTRQARSFKEAKLSKVDALIAQDSWAIACHWGIPEACTRLGALAEFGFYSHQTGELAKGVPSLKTAAELYARAAELGDPLGAERSGVLLEHGQGIPQDYLAARQAYISACDAGYPHACARWGFMNELGLGGETKLFTAVTAYQRACQAGSQWACDRLKSERLRALY